MGDYLASIGPAVANHLWQSTAFAALAAALALALRKNQARARYWVWMAASLKFLLPFALLAALGGQIGGHMLKPRAMAAPAGQTMYFAVEDFSEPFVAQPGAIAAPAAVPHPLRAELLPLAFAAVWLGGFVGVLAVWWVRWRRIAVALRRAEPLREGREADALRRIGNAAGLRRAIQLRLSAGAMEPGVFGIARPILAWPAGISERLDDAHLEAIVAHEVCHVCRRDNLTAALHMLVEAAFWFHPLVWWMGARLVAERERACDEEVLRLGGRPQAYAEGILKVCAFCVESPLECVAGVTGADLKQRVVQIMAAPSALRLTWPKKLLLAAAMLCAAAVPVMLGQAKAARRMMLAAVEKTPMPFRAAAHAMIAEEQTPSTGQIAEAQAPALPADNSAPAAGDMSLGPEFEVATIRPSGPDPVMMRWQPTNDGLIVNAQSLRMLITYAYGVLPEYVLGGPGWTGTQLFDINAKYGEKATEALAKLPPKQRSEQTQATLRILLAERFKLKVRRETKDAAIYELVVAKGGPKFTKSAPLAAGPDGRVPPEGGGSTGYPDGRLVMKRTSMLMLAKTLSRDPEVAREVVDATGLKGPYDFEYTWKASQDGSGPSLFTALQEQLGLNLVASKGPIETLVIDHVEKPASVDGAEVPDPVASASTQAAAAKAATQAALPEMSFDVVSIRPSPADARMMTPPNGTAENFIARMASVESMIGFAYDIPTVIGMSVDPAHFFLPQAPELIGGPGWVRTDRYDLTAKVSGPEYEAWKRLPEEQQKEELRQMLRAVLADRFKLAVRHENRELEVYALVKAKDGPKFKATAGTSADVNDGDDPAKPYDPAKAYRNRWKRGPGLIEGQDVTIDGLLGALWMQRELAGRKVLDRTGLTGRYDLSLKWASVDDPKEPDGPSLFTAIQEQLGLKLEPTKAPMDVLVIDHVERPSEN